jgi:pyruvate/2-oxoglutarate dehydrogenase complex dihydrolipoamide dehydrogenase (E3) component
MSPGEQRALDDRLDRARVDHVHPEAWINPRPAERYNLVIIGAGPGGLTAAREAAALGAKVALIERTLIGGDSLNVGSVPTKAIIRTSRLYGDMRDAATFGARNPGQVGVDFQEVTARVRRIQERLSRPFSARRLSEAGVDVYFGEARFIGPDSVSVAGATLRFAKALIATGARPVTPPIPGLIESGFTCNEAILDRAECPRVLVVIGGGPLGCEMAQAFCRFGSHVVIAQDEPTFLPKEDREAAQIVSDTLGRDGVEIHLNTSVTAVRVEAGRKIVEMVSDGGVFSAAADEIVVGIGRAPNVDGLGLDAAGVEYDTISGIHVDDYLRTSNRRIFAAGDVCLDLKFTHAAEASARIALANALFPRRRRMSALTIPWCTYTDPEIAHIGLYIWDAWDRGIPVETFTILLQDVDRAVTDGEDVGFVKVHVRHGTDEILGATVVASHAGDMINGLSLAISTGIGLGAIGRVIHTYPTQSGAIKMAGEAYERARFTPARKALSARWLARSVGREPRS